MIGQEKSQSYWSNFNRRSSHIRVDSASRSTVHRLTGQPEAFLWYAVCMRSLCEHWLLDSGYEFMPQGVLLGRCFLFRGQQTEGSLKKTGLEKSLCKIFVRAWLSLWSICVSDLWYVLGKRITRSFTLERPGENLTLLPSFQSQRGQN